jgi:hypothetical protein
LQDVKVAIERKRAGNSAKDFLFISRSRAGREGGVLACLAHRILVSSQTRRNNVKLCFGRIGFVAASIWCSYAFGEDFPNADYSLPQGAVPRVFELSQAYPSKPSPGERHAWDKIDFKADPEKYLQTVLEYCYEGNFEVDFVVQNNAIRHWYHAPWLHYGNNGREAVRGLTRERASLPFELGPNQTQRCESRAIGFYNEPGGYVLGNVWADHNHPNYELVAFPEGTVSFKLLFTTATDKTVEFLNGAPEWLVDLGRGETPRTVHLALVRLLQVDVSVRDNRSSCAGWVFGTFHYDVAVPESNPWKRLRPLTLSWGNDPGLSQADYQKGSRPKESWVNEKSPLVQYRTRPPLGTKAPSTLGYAGRANGPVDNPISSCLSCHSTAEIPANSPLVPRAGASDQEVLRYFRNLAPGEAFDSGSKNLDFSLQLGVGLQNFAKANAARPAILAEEQNHTLQSTAGAEEGKIFDPGPFTFTRDP